MAKLEHVRVRETGYVFSDQGKRIEDARYSFAHANDNNLSRANNQGKLVHSAPKHANLANVQTAPTKTCSKPYTRANKLVQKLIKKNLLVS